MFGMEDELQARIEVLELENEDLLRECKELKNKLNIWGYMTLYDDLLNCYVCEPDDVWSITLTIERSDLE